MEKEPRQVAYEELTQLATRRGYVTYDDIMDCSDNFSLSLQDFDWLTNSLTSIGIIIYLESPTLAEQFNDEVDDYAQIDYEIVYSKIKELSPALAPFVDAIREIRPPQRNEIKRLKYQITEGNQHARDRMIEMYLRLALRIALQRAESYDMDIEDAVSYACIGLITAVDRYDPDSSGPFASYAGMWVLQNISREQPNRRPLMYYPAHIKEGYFSVYPFLKQYGCIGCSEMQSCGEIREKIMARLECSAMSVIEQATAIEYIEDFLDLFEENNPGLEYSDRLGLALMKLSPDTVVSEDAALDDVYLGAMREAIGNVLKTLTPRERQIACERYGLLDGIAKTLEEIGSAMDVTRERIRQIEAKALRKLRHPTRRRLIEDFYE